MKKRKHSVGLSQALRRRSTDSSELDSPLLRQFRRQVQIFDVPIKLKELFV